MKLATTVYNNATMNAILPRIYGIPKEKVSTIYALMLRIKKGNEDSMG